MNRTTILAILQQSEYDWDRLQTWVKDHQGDNLEVSDLTWTAKLKLVDGLSQVFFWLSPLAGIKLALAMLAPAEWLIRQITYARAQTKLGWYRWHGLNIVAVAGSYGKTSTKTILQHSLSSQTPTLVTPHSINTMLGIADVILHQLQPEHKLFVVEFGEYHPQDIPELTNFVKPDYGILTPLGRQHLELLGGFDQVVATFTHFISYFERKPERLLIHDHNQQFLNTPIADTADWYGTDSQSTVRAFNTKVSRAGTEFEVLDKLTQHTYSVFCPLYGEHQTTNILPAFWLATQLNLDLATVIKKIRVLPYVHRRHEPNFANQGVLILDNSYNTNPDSAQASLELLKQLDATKRFVITLGFTELGDEAQKIHTEFGQQLAGIADYLGLIKAPWTNSIIEGYVKAGGKKSHVVVAESSDAALTQLQEFVVPNSLILLEGGYREVYV